MQSTIFSVILDVLSRRVGALGFLVWFEQPWDDRFMCAQQTAHICICLLTVWLTCHQRSLPALTDWQLVVGRPGCVYATPELITWMDYPQLWWDRYTMHLAIFHRLRRSWVVPVLIGSYSSTQCTLPCSWCLSFDWMILKSLLGYIVWNRFMDRWVEEEKNNYTNIWDGLCTSVTVNTFGFFLFLYLILVLMFKPRLTLTDNALA